MRRLTLFLASMGLTLAIWIVAYGQAIIPEQATVPNKGSAALICPMSPTLSVEAAIWVGLPKSLREGPRFVTQCIYCAIHEGCQDQSVYPQLDQVNYRWQRTNAGCFPGQMADENVSVTLTNHIVENGGGCNE